MVPIAQSTISNWECGFRTPGHWLAYVICVRFQVEPSVLALQSVLTPPVRSELAELTQAAGRRQRATMAPVAPGYLELPPTEAAGGPDWERLGATMRSLRGIDSTVLEDQWILTRRYFADMRFLSARTMLDLISGHLSRLRQLRGMARHQSQRYELGIMICQTAVGAGILATGLTDFGLAMDAYRYSTDVAREMNDRTLLATGLVLQAQMYGGILHPQLALSSSRMTDLLETSAACCRSGASPQAQVFLSSTRSGVHVQIGMHDAARRDIDLAHRAEARAGRAAEPFFALTTNAADYATIHEAGVELALQRPQRAIELYSVAAGRADAPNIKAWLQWSLAVACVRADEPALAAPAALEARRLARAGGAPLLLHGTEKVADALVARHGAHVAVKQLQDRIRTDETREGDDGGFR